MDRRQWLKFCSLGMGSAGLPLLAGGLSGSSLGAEPVDVGSSALTPLKITDVKTILTAPAGIRLVVVKVITSEPGLYGLGCATFTQRATESDFRRGNGGSKSGPA